MARLCDSCKWYNKQIDEQVTLFDDTNTQSLERHGCIMYQDYIPQKIWYKNGDCPYHVSKEAKKNGKGS